LHCGETVAENHHNWGKSPHAFQPCSEKNAGQTRAGDRGRPASDGSRGNEALEAAAE
jgi:hypothetical protein